MSCHISSTLSLYFGDVLVPWVNMQTEFWHKDLHCIRIVANVATCFLHSVLLAAEKHWEKCRIVKPFLREKKTYEDASAGVKNNRNLSAWVRLRKSIFNCSTRAFPEHNKLLPQTRTGNLRERLPAQQFCTWSFIEATLIAATQLWSMSSYQYLSLLPLSCTDNKLIKGQRSLNCTAGCLRVI